MTRGNQEDPILKARELWRDQGYAAEDAMTAMVSVMRTQQVLLSRIESVLSPFGLKLSQFQVLMILATNPDGQRSLSSVSWHIVVHQATLSNVVNRLEDAGLVERLPDPNDGRGTLARITPRGLKVGAAASEALVKANFGLPLLDSEDYQKLIDTLVEIRWSW